MLNLTCDICGSTLIMQSSMQEAVCSCCGIKYPLEILRKKIADAQDVENTTFTGKTEKDSLADWKSAVDTYIHGGDFLAAESLIKQILDVQPKNQMALECYSKLQEWKYMDVRNGVLISYTGCAENITLPDCVKEIGEHAFCPMTKAGHYEGNQFIKEITISNVIKIGAAAFSHTTIESVNNTQNLREIGKSAFWDSHLKKIDIPGTVVEIEDGTFYGCVELEEISMQKTIKRIGKNALLGCISLKRVDIPNLLTIEDGTFCGCKGLQEIIIPDSVRKIGENAFEACTALKTVVLPEELTEISRGAFEKCISLKEINIPMSFLAEKHFYRRKNLYKEVETVYKGPIGVMAFDGCNALNDLHLPKGIDRDYIKAFSTFLGNQNSPFGRRQRGVCQYCGGEFKGLFKWVCKKCKRPPNYKGYWDVSNAD